MQLDNISISLTSNTFLTILGIIFLAAYSFYIYKFTIPQVSITLKYILVVLRAITIIFLFLLIFEPIINLTSKEQIEPSTFLFVDNSNSLAAKDSINRVKNTKSFIEDLLDSKSNIQLSTFSSKVKTLGTDHLDSIDFTGHSTNFSNIISDNKTNNKNISSIVVLSDGIINDGSDPIFEAEKLPFPIFTVGVGDTTQYRDIQIRDVLFNQYIYAQKPTEIEITTTQLGFDGKTVRINLFDENKLVESKDIELNPAGINKIRFNYTPENAGEIKMRAAITPIAGESNLFNNTKSFFINVLRNKIKIGLIAGSPSADISAISNALESDKNFEVKKLIQVSGNKYWKDLQPSIIDSAEVLFLVDFPASNTSQNILQKIINIVQTENKPFFFLLSQNVDTRRLKEMENVLPFSISRITDGFLQTQPDLLGNSLNTVFTGLISRDEVWNNLPPVSKSNSEIVSKPGSNVLIKSKVRNIPIASPLIITRSIGNGRSIALLAGDVWRWELLAAEKYPGFFQNLMQDFVKWLSASDKQKQFSVRTSKKIYASSEPVEFTAELYDQTFMPIDSANITLSLTRGGQKYDLALQKERPGIFTAAFENAEPGDYIYEATANYNSAAFKSNQGRFTAGEGNIEKDNTRMDINFLKQLASSTNGEYYPIENYSGLKEKIEKLYSTASKEKTLVSEIDFRSNEWIMLIIICLFAAEWFIRKRAGML